MNNLGVYKLVPEATLPTFGTPGSACFDLSCCFHGPVYGFDANNDPITLDGSLVLSPGSRILIPTGLIFQIPEHYFLQMSARSSMGLKNGLILANGIGIIDSDYVDEVFMCFINVSGGPMVLTDGQRMCQARLVPVLDVEILECSGRPERCGRMGGFGSTGV